MARRISLSFSLILAALAVALIGSASASAAIGPPWCGTPSPDGTAALPDGTLPTDPVGSYPHIPWYAVGCTLDAIAAQSNGRMTVEVIGQSALGRDMYLATINALDTKHQKQSFKNWQQFRKLAPVDPKKAQIGLWSMHDKIKVPLYVQAGIHGNESEGIDASLQIIERLATTPYGAEPEVDTILDNAVVLFNVIHNPDGHIANQRANGNNFDLNRDFLTQSQSETKASVAIMQKWLPPEVLDLHGYVTPTLIEATTKPHNPSIEYDLWLKWNQSRIDANEAAMNAIGMAVTRPVNDWCPNGDLPPASTGLCAGGIQPGPAVAEGWDDWGPFYTPMYAQHIGLNGSTVEMCNSTGTACGVPGSTTHPRGRIGSRTAQYTVVWSTLLYDVANRYDLTWDQAEIYIRGEENAPRPPCCPPPFEVANNWMTEYPTAHLIPLGKGQRSDAEANRLVQWLLDNGIEVGQSKVDFTYGGQEFEQGTYIVEMTQAHRGLANTALGIGDDVSASITQLYAPPGAWSHGYLWGADIVTVPRDPGDFHLPQQREIKKPAKLSGGVDRGKADRYVLEIDSATAVRALNELVGSGVTAQIALAEFAGAGGTLAAGSAVFAADPATKATLDALGKERGLHFQPTLAASLPALDSIDHTPRIAVLTAAVNQDVWSLRNLGFTADPISTATINTALTDPLEGYDVVFNTAAWPSAANPLARTRLTAFFARGGGYLGAGANGGNFLTTGAQLVGLTAVSRTGNGRSGILYWSNTLGAASPVVGAYPAIDTLIADPPTWFTTVPTTLTVDGRLPASGILAAGLWLMDPQSASAPGSAVIAHGTNAAGTARVTLFANNPLYRADPEREWPSLGAAAYWVDQ